MGGRCRAAVPTPTRLMGRAGERVYRRMTGGRRVGGLKRDRVNNRRCAGNKQRAPSPNIGIPTTAEVIGEGDNRDDEDVDDDDNDGGDGSFLNDKNRNDRIAQRKIKKIITQRSPPRTRTLSLKY